VFQKWSHNLQLSDKISYSFFTSRANAMPTSHPPSLNRPKKQIRVTYGSRDIMCTPMGCSSIEVCGLAHPFRPWLSPTYRPQLTGIFWNCDVPSSSSLHYDFYYYWWSSGFPQHLAHGPPDCGLCRVYCQPANTLFGRSFVRISWVSCKSHSHLVTQLSKNPPDGVWVEDTRLVLNNSMILQGFHISMNCSNLSCFFDSFFIP
jgi:hypothetical protein